MDPCFFLPCFHGPRASRLGHKRKEKTRSITCRTDRANEANKRYIFESKGTCSFSAEDLIDVIISVQQTCFGYLE